VKTDNPDIPRYVPKHEDYGRFADHYFKPENFSILEYILCPFCGCPGIEAKPGKTFCHKCNYHFYIDDRVECVFADPENLRLPLKGAVCPVCGLIQGEDSEHCVYCNTNLNSNNNYC
jgi:hypothetical protein